MEAIEFFAWPINSPSGGLVGTNLLNQIIKGKCMTYIQRYIYDDMKRSGLEEQN